MSIILFVFILFFKLNDSFGQCLTPSVLAEFDLNNGTYSQAGVGTSLEIQYNNSNQTYILVPWHVVGSANRIYRICGEEKTELKLFNQDPNKDLALFIDPDNSLGIELNLADKESDYKKWSGQQPEKYYFIINSQFSNFIEKILNSPIGKEFKRQSELNSKWNFIDKDLLRLDTGIFLKENSNKFSLVKIGSQRLEQSSKSGSIYGLIDVESPILISNFSPWFGMSGSIVFESTDFDPKSNDFTFENIVGIISKTELDGSSAILIPHEDILKFIENSFAINKMFSTLVLEQIPSLKDGKLNFNYQLKDTHNDRNKIISTCEDSDSSSNVGGDWGGGSISANSKNNTNYWSLPDLSETFMVRPPKNCKNGHVLAISNSNEKTVWGIIDNNKYKRIFNLSDLLKHFNYKTSGNELFKSISSSIPENFDTSYCKQLESDFNFAFMHGNKKLSSKMKVFIDWLDPKMNLEDLALSHGAGNFRNVEFSAKNIKCNTNTNSFSVDLNMRLGEFQFSTHSIYNDNNNHDFDLKHSKALINQDVCTITNNSEITYSNDGVMSIYIVIPKECTGTSPRIQHNYLFLLPISGEL